MSFPLSTKMDPVENISVIVLMSFLTDSAPQNVYLLYIHLFFRSKKKRMIIFQ